jgi:hypothetical protein
VQFPWDKDRDLVEIERNLCGTGGVTASEIWAPPAADPRQPAEAPVVFFVVVFDVHDKTKTASYGEVKILAVSVAGATLALAGALEIGQELLLINPATGKQALCRVRSVDPKEDGRNHVGVDFAAATATSTPNARFPNVRLVAALAIFVAAGVLFAATLHRFAVPPSSARNAPGSGANTYPLDQRDLENSGVPLDRDSAYPPGFAYAASPAGASRPFPLLPEVLRLIPNIAEFRIATAPDFDPQAASWLSRWRLSADGVIPGNFAGSGQSQAYILLGKDNSWRVIIMADVQLLCDVRYQTIAIAARLPREFVPSIQWEGPAPPQSDRDGLLIVRSAQDPSSAVVLFLQGGEVVSGNRPADYRRVPLAHVP